MKNQAAVELGKKGGQAKTKAKAKAARENAKKPRGRWVSAVAYEFLGVDGEGHFGVMLLKRSFNPDLSNHDNFVKILDMLAEVAGCKVNELREFATRSERL